MRGTDPQTQNGEKMAMLQDFAKGLIANVQAEAAQLTLMADELSRQGADTQMSAGEPGGVDDLLDFMRKLEEDLVAEMMEQEQEMVRQYLAQQEQEDSALVQAAQSEEVICPVCLHESLVMNANGFSCQCGMRIMLPNLSLPQLQANIHHAFSAHGASGCWGVPAVESRPSFPLPAASLPDTLVMACKVCNCRHVLAGPADINWPEPQWR